MTELELIVKGVLKELDGAGALADYLQENDREKEAVLLRRRWGMWKKRRSMAMVESLMAAYPARKNDYWARAEEGRRERACDAAFARYIRSRFQTRKKPAPPAPHVCAVYSGCCCSSSADEPSDDCPIHGCGSYPRQCQTCGRILPRDTVGVML